MLTCPRSAHCQATRPSQIIDIWLESQPPVQSQDRTMIQSTPVMLAPQAWSFHGPAMTPYRCALIDCSKLTDRHIQPCLDEAQTTMISWHMVWVVSSRVKYERWHFKQFPASIVGQIRSSFAHEAGEALCTRHSALMDAHTCEHMRVSSLEQGLP